MRFWLTAAAVLILDRISKWWIMENMNVGDCWALISGFINIRYIHNEGAAFGILQGRSLLFMLMAAIVIVATIYFIYKYNLPALAHFSLGLIVGGALGNLIDRIIYGSVVDFISVGWFPVFNIADSAIVCGGALLVWWMFMDETIKSA
ncbi:MAG: signal peptidase II [Syntrophomonadaceae bacterium]|nr:signal peptidase II [Syntrophomonadaceae bacterium]